MYTQIQREEQKKKLVRSPNHDPYSTQNFEQPSGHRANQEDREAFEERRWGELTELAQTLRDDRIQREQSESTKAGPKTEPAINRMPSPSENVESDKKTSDEDDRSTTVLLKESENFPSELQSKSETLQRSADGSGTAPPQTESKINSMRQSGGVPMDNSTRNFMESRMGHDFSEVRVHTGGDAESTSKDLNAKAYTIGNDIAFNKGEYQPETKQGKELIAHELTHTIQQGGVKRKVQKKGAAPVVPEVEKIQAKPLVQRQTAGYSSILTPTQIIWAVNVNQARHEYRYVMLLKILQATGAKRLYDAALEDAKAFLPDRKKGLRKNFALLVEFLQYKLKLPRTGYLDKTTARKGNLLYKQNQKDSAHYAAIYIMKRMRRIDILGPKKSGKQREEVWKSLKKAADRMYAWQIFSYLETDKNKPAGFTGSKEQFIPWMFYKLPVRRERFAAIVRKHGGRVRIGRIRMAQLFASKDSEESLRLLMMLQGSRLTGFLSEMEKIAKKKGKNLAYWIFEEKLKTPEDREKLRMHYFSKKAPKLAKEISAHITAYKIGRLLLHSRRDESDFGIVSYFQDTPRAWRKRVISLLSTLTRGYFGVSAQRKLQSTMLPMHYKRLRKVSGVNLKLSPRKLGLKEKVGVYADRVRIFGEVLVLGGLNLIIQPAKVILIFVKDLLVGLWDAAKVAKDFLYASLYKLTNGENGIDEYRRTEKLIDGLKAIKEDPIGTAKLVIEEVWNDIKINWSSILKSGPGAGGRLAVFIGDMIGKFILNLALVFLSLAAGLGAGMKFITRMSFFLKIARKKRALTIIRRLMGKNKVKAVNRLKRSRQSLNDAGYTGKQVDALLRVFGESRLNKLVEDIGASSVKKFLDAMPEKGVKLINKFSPKIRGSHLRAIIDNTHSENLARLFQKFSPHQMKAMIRRLGGETFGKYYANHIGKHAGSISSYRLVNLTKDLPKRDLLRLIRWARPRDLNLRLRDMGAPGLKLLARKSSINGPQLRSLLRDLDGDTLLRLVDPKTGVSGREILRLQEQLGAANLKKLAILNTGRAMLALNKKGKGAIQDALKKINPANLKRPSVSRFQTLTSAKSWVRKHLRLSDHTFKDLSLEAVNTLRYLSDELAYKLGRLTDSLQRLVLGCASPCKVELHNVIVRLKAFGTARKRGRLIKSVDDIVEALPPPRKFNRTKLVRILKNDDEAYLRLIKEAKLRINDLEPFHNYLTAVDARDAAKAAQKFGTYLGSVIPHRIGPNRSAFEKINALLGEMGGRGSALKGPFFENFVRLYVHPIRGAKRTWVKSKYLHKNREIDAWLPLTHKKGDIYEIKNYGENVVPPKQIEDYFKIKKRQYKTIDGETVRQVHYVFFSKESAMHNLKNLKRAGFQVYYIIQSGKNVALREIF